MPWTLSFNLSSGRMYCFLSLLPESLSTYIHPCATLVVWVCQEIFVWVCAVAKRMLMKTLWFEKDYHLYLFYGYWLLITEHFKEISQMENGWVLHITILLLPNEKINFPSKLFSNSFSIIAPIKALFHFQVKHFYLVFIPSFTEFIQEQDIYKFYKIIHVYKKE